MKTRIILLVKALWEQASRAYCGLPTRQMPLSVSRGRLWIPQPIAAGWPK